MHSGGKKKGRKNFLALRSDSLELLLNLCKSEGEMS